MRRSVQLVPEGWFVMGVGPERVPEAECEEGPERRVWLGSFVIATPPVTVGGWTEFVTASNYGWHRFEELAAVSPSDLHPAVFVSWHDCQAFVEWLSARTAERWSLPTEAQWERACRGTDGRLYPWGDDERDWIEELGGAQIGNRPVGSDPLGRSAVGCADMWSNVSEWCRDWFDDEGPARDSTRNPTGPESGRFKCFRGGFAASTGWPRCSYRGFQKPEFRHEGLGFRVARSK